MKIQFTERKVTVPEEVKAFATKKCEKLDRFFDRDTSAYVTFTVEKGQNTAEITVQSGGMYFRAQERTGDMHASIDGALESIEKQILKNKTRLEKRLRQGAFEKNVPFAAELDASDEEYDLVRVKPMDMKPMTVDDAILQMNLLSHTFFFFINSEEKGRHCVVYKRKDGGYGMLISAD